MFCIVYFFLTLFHNVNLKKNIFNLTITGKKQLKMRFFKIIFSNIFYYFMIYQPLKIIIFIFYVYSFSTICVRY